MMHEALMGSDLTRVREHIEAIVLGRDPLTPEEIKGSEGELRSVLAGLQVINKQLKDRTAALVSREAWFKGVMSAARVAIWECDVSVVRQMLADEATLARLDADVGLVRALAERVKIVGVNQEALDLFGATNLQMLDGCLDDIVRDESVALFRSLLRAIGRGDAHAKLEGTMYGLGGDEIHVVVALIAPEGASGAITLAWSDLSGHQKRLEAEQAARQQSKELERVNKEVERLFRAVSHDLRAPLRAVQNLAEWALEDLEAKNHADIPGHLNALVGRVGRLERMLTDLLSYARIGRAEHAFESVGVGELLTEVHGMLELPHGFGVTWQKPMPSVVTQRTLLSQVFLNLISNAVKHHDAAHEGEVVVTADDQESFVKFSVRDNGPGIPQKHRAKIFGLFTTLKRRDEVEGSGMGLAFVQKVVRSQGGKIEVVGPEGRGVAFEFTWPKGPTARKQKKNRPPTLVGFKWGEKE